LVPFEEIKANSRRLSPFPLKPAISVEEQHRIALGDRCERFDILRRGGTKYLFA
jgi:hypothetical protein